MPSENIHIPREKLSDDARLMHYAIASLMEELEAVDWYRQRADDSEDDSLRSILLHNMGEEMEHASMLIEWLRRRNPDFAGHVRTYLFTERPIVGIEKAAEAVEAGAAKGESPKPEAPRIDLLPTVGSLKGPR